MSRFKIRGRRKKDGQWLYGNLLECETLTSIISAEELDSTELDRFGPLLVHNAVDKETVGVSTGCVDKNGKEIFEGDLLRSNRHPYRIYEKKDICFACVRFRKAAHRLSLVVCKNLASRERSFYAGDVDDQAFIHWHPEEWEVVGNIHDNPDMAKID